MTRYILLVLGFFIFFGAQAQYTDPDLGGHGLIKTKAKVFKDLEGSPYLQENFAPGVVYLEGKEPIKAFLRLNVLEGEMEIKVQEQSEEIFVLESEGDSYYSIGGREYKKDVHHGLSGFAGVLYDGEKISLFVKPSAQVSEPVLAKTGYESDKPGRISIEENYYLIFADGKVEEVRIKNRDIKKLFDSDEAKDYLSDNKIKSEEDLVAFLKFYDQLN